MRVALCLIRDYVTGKRGTSVVRPLDRTALATLSACAAVAVAAIAIGDRVGLQVLEVTPEAGAEGVSTLATIEIRFSEPVDRAGRSVTLAIEPPVAGSLRWGNRTLRFDAGRSLSARTRYTVRLAGTLRAASGRRLRAPLEWSFDTGTLRIAYVTEGAAERTRIAARTVIAGGGDGPERVGDEQTLASFERPVRDFHRAPDGGTLVATLGTDVFAADLWLVDLQGGGSRELLDCGDAECSAARWAPDGTAIVFSQRRLPLPPRPWLIDPSSGDDRPLLQQEVIGFDPRWSSDGAWVAFVSPLEGGLRIVGIADGRTVLVPTRAAAPAAWRPGALTLLTSDLREEGGQVTDVLISIDLMDLSVRTALSPEHGGGRSPAWAADGGRFAFIRSADAGEELWLATDAGGPHFEAAPLATPPRLTYREIVFAPGGDLIAAQRSRLDVAYPEPEVVVFDLSGRERAVIAAAATPRWLP
jgi:hypothetical protein